MALSISIVGRDDSVGDGDVPSVREEVIGQRTKDALAVKKSQGYRLGRPVGIAPEVATEIQALRASGSSLRTIAESLKYRNIPTS